MFNVHLINDVIFYNGIKEKKICSKMLHKEYSKLITVNLIM